MKSSIPLPIMIGSIAGFVSIIMAVVFVTVSSNQQTRVDDVLKPQILNNNDPSNTHVRFLTNDELGQAASGMTWFGITELQCTISPYPWINEWNRAHPDEPYFGLSLSKKQDAVVEFIRNNDVTISDIVYTPAERVQGFYCEACGCNTGWTVYILISREDSEKVESLTYRSLQTTSYYPREITAEDVTYIMKSHARTLNYTVYRVPNEGFHDPEYSVLVKKDWENRLLLDQENVASLIEERRYEDAISILQELRKQVNGSAGCVDEDDVVLEEYQEEVLRVLDNFVGVLQIALNKVPLTVCD